MVNRKKAFTLVEIITVMAIVSLLVSLAIVEGVKFRRLANESNCQANLKAIATAFEVYAASHSGSYAPGVESSLQFLVNAGCLNTDLVELGQIGTFRYTIATVWPGGYDIRANASSTALAEHNYQIVTGGILRRSDTSSDDDSGFSGF
ncbi:prepilin-type N-terminal cleavage/methylation domain-containing protein [bacterium]|nr:MAG: prepilin-type N-terminal cleavage/methylation domain-containing protein [bacterium]